MDNMSEATVQELQTEVAVLRTRVEGLEQGRFAALEAKVDASREVVEARLGALSAEVSNNREVLEARIDANHALIEEQGKRLDRMDGRLDRIDTRMDRLEGAIERVGTRLTIYLAAATAIIAVIQFLTR